MGPQVQNMFVWLAEQLRRFVSPQVFCSVALLVSAAKMGKKLTPAQLKAKQAKGAKPLQKSQEAFQQQTLQAELAAMPAASSDNTPC